MYPPEAATSDTGLPCSCAMKPMTEKMTKPAKMLVPVLMHDISMASLEDEEVKVSALVVT